MMSLRLSGWRVTLPLLVLLLGAMALVFFMAPASRADTLYVDNGDEGNFSEQSELYSTISEALAAAKEGDTINVCDGVYPEHIWINKANITLQGNGSDKTIILDPRGTVQIHGDGAVFRGFGIRNGGKGDVVGLRIHARDVSVLECKLPTLVVSQSRGSGLTLRENQLEFGIDFLPEFWFPGTLEFWTSHDIDRSNTLGGSPISYLQGQKAAPIPEDVGQLILVDCKDMVVEGLDLEEAKGNILLAYCQNITVRENRVATALFGGIQLQGSEQMLLQNNQCLGGSNGIYLDHSSHNLIENNRCSGSSNGISLFSSTNNDMFNNDLSFNNKGILIDDSPHSRVENNSCLENRYEGIKITNSHNSALAWNRCQDNNGSGIRVQNCDNSKLLKNRCQDNRKAGITLRISKETTAVKNICQGNRNGIFVHNGELMKVSNNICSGNLEAGILVHRDRGGLKIQENQCLSNQIGLLMTLTGASRVENNSFTTNQEYGIHAEGWGNNFTGNKIAKNRIGMGLVYRGNRGGPENNVSYNRIQNNAKAGLEAPELKNYILPADYNWWGDESGPYHPLENPTGKGDAVLGTVSISHWLLENGEVKVPEPFLGNGERRLELQEDISLSQDQAYALVGGLLVLAAAGGMAGFPSSEQFRYRLGLAALPLYTRLGGGDIEADLHEHSIRGRIFRYIMDLPGASFSEIRKELKIGTGTTVYHLTVLQREGFIRSAKSGKRKLFWVKTNFPGSGKAALTRVQKRILWALEEAGELSRTCLQERTKIPRTTLAANLRELERCGKVAEERRGRENYCRLLKET